MKCVPSVQLTCLRPGHAAVLKKVSTAYGRAAAPAPGSMPRTSPWAGGGACLSLCLSATAGKQFPMSGVGRLFSRSVKVLPYVDVASHSPK